MLIALGCDHGGFDLMQSVKAFLDTKGYKYKDFGTFTKDSCDYPEFGAIAARAVSSGECDRGILICTTGIGIGITANKISGIRAALCTNSFMAEMARRHNDANVLALGAFVTGSGLSLDIVKAFLVTDFEGGKRHVRRVDMINALDI